MRVAILANRFPTVSQTFIFNKVLGLVQAGVDVTVFSHGKGDREAFAGRLDRSTRVVVLQPPISKGVKSPAAAALLVSGRPVESANLLRAAHKLYGNTRRGFRAWAMALPLHLGGFDIVHFEFSGVANTYRDAIRLLHAPKIMMSCRGADEQIAPIVKTKRAERLRQLVGMMDAVHCVSENMLQTMREFGLDAARGFVNRPAIDTSYFQRKHPYSTDKADPFRLVTVGRLHWKKGHEFALMAFRQLVQEGFNVQYELVGKGDEEERLRFTVRDLEIESRVRFLGALPSDRVRDVLEHADVFLLPSLSEGLSNAALEAMAMGVPVVSTTAGGMNEAIEDSISGCLVPPRDAQAIALKTAELLSDPSRRMRIGGAASARIRERFTIEGQVSCFLETYDRLIRNDTLR